VPEATQAPERCPECLTPWPRFRRELDVEASVQERLYGERRRTLDVRPARPARVVRLRRAA